MKQLDVSIIYVNYKTASLIINSIASVRQRSEGFSYEIIIVDNHSGDDSIVRLRDKCPDCRIIESLSNIGFGRANNLAISEAKGQCLFFLNPDTILLNNAIKVLFEHLQTNPRCAACGGNLYDEKLKPTYSLVRRIPNLFDELLLTFYIVRLSFPSPRSSYFNRTNHPLQVASISGADLMVRRSVLDVVGGGFDPVFFMNGEETDLCQRIIRAGYLIHSVPQAQIMHFEGRSSYISMSRQEFLFDSQFITANKVGGGRRVRLLYLILLFRTNFRWLLLFLFPNKRKYWAQKKRSLKKVYYARWK